MFFCMWRCVFFVSLYFRNDTQVAFYRCFVCIANTNVILHTPISRRGAAASEQVSLILIFYKNQSTASLFLLYPTKPVGFCGNPVFAFCLSLCIFIRLRLLYHQCKPRIGLLHTDTINTSAQKPFRLLNLLCIYYTTRKM